METKFKLGDKVFDYLRQGWGTVFEVQGEESLYPIEVQFANLDTENYTVDGCMYRSSKAPVLFFDEVPLIVPPERPLPQLPVDTKVIVWKNTAVPEKYSRYFSHFTSDGKAVCFINGATSWSEKKTVTWDNWELVSEGE